MPPERLHYPAEPLYGPAGGPMSHAIPLHGPVSHPDGPRDYGYPPPPPQHLPPHFVPGPPPPLPEQLVPSGSGGPPPPPQVVTNGTGRRSPKPEFFAPGIPESFHRTQGSHPPSPGPDPAGTPLPTPVGTGAGANHYPSSTGVPRLPPILQVEKQQVTTSATQLASASRRRNEAHFVCPVPGCGSTFTRRFNLRGHLRSHTEERPYVCDFEGCNKGFARQHDCKRHQALHNTTKASSNICQGCKKTFSRLDALNRHLRSDGGADCRSANQKYTGPPPPPPPVVQNVEDPNGREQH